MAIAALLAANPKPRRQPAPEADLTTRLVDLARDKPIIAAAALVAAGVVAVRNPKITAGLVAAFMAAKPPGPRKP